MCYCLDLRSDSKLGKFLSNKIVAALTAVIQLVIWAGMLITIISPPESVREQIASSPSGTTAFLVIFILVGIAFSILLMVGILKNKKLFIQLFLAFNVFVIGFIFIGIIYNIFTQPSRFGLSGFLSSVLRILMDVLTYFVIRNYYLGLNSRPTTSQAQNQGPKGFGV